MSLRSTYSRRRAVLWSAARSQQRCSAVQWVWCGGALPIETELGGSAAHFRPGRRNLATVTSTDSSALRIALAARHTTQPERRGNNDRTTTEPVAARGCLPAPSRTLAGANHLSPLSSPTTADYRACFCSPSAS